MYIIPAMALKRGRQIKGTAKHKGAKGQVTRKMTRTKRSKPKLKPSIEILIKDASKLRLQRRLRQTQRLIETKMQKQPHHLLQIQKLYLNHNCQNSFSVFIIFISLLFIWVFYLQFLEYFLYIFRVTLPN
jgi:hypothetical protein